MTTAICTTTEAPIPDLELTPMMSSRNNDKANVVVNDSNTLPKSDCQILTMVDLESLTVVGFFLSLVAVR